eukprot:Em0002g1740a
MLLPAATLPVNAELFQGLLGAMEANSGETKGPPSEQQEQFTAPDAAVHSQRHLVHTSVPHCSSSGCERMLELTAHFSSFSINWLFMLSKGGLGSYLVSSRIQPCITGPLTQGILTDVGVIANIPVYGNCSSPYLTSAIRILLAVGIHSTVVLTLTLISAVQFSMLYFRYQITLKMVCTAFIFIVVYSSAINSLRFTGTYREIRGPICTQEGEIATISNIILSIAFVIPLIVAVACSVLTCLKTKNSMTSTAGNSAVRSVVVLNSLNIMCYVALRVPGLVVFFLGKQLRASGKSQGTLDQLVVIGQYIGDISYPLTALSILILHSGIRRMAFSCCKKMKTDILISSSAANTTKSSSTKF